MLLMLQACNSSQDAMDTLSESLPVPALQAEGQGRAVVAVLAHPDDETLIAPALSHMVRGGAKVFLVLATDGARGEAAHAKVPVGDALARVRAREARCSAAALGLQPPILMGYPDGGLGDPAPGDRLDSLAMRLDSLFRRVRPDVVITWGPEGGYGHTEHRLVGQVVTQLFQAGSVPPGARLYFPGFKRERAATAPEWYGQRLRPVSDSLLTAAMSFEPVDHTAAERSIACHWSQAAPRQQARNLQALDHLWQGVVQFQRWRGGLPGDSLL